MKIFKNEKNYIKHLYEEQGIPLSDNTITEFKRKYNVESDLDLPFFIFSGGFFFDYLPNQLNRSPNTIKSYKLCMRHLKEFVVSQIGNRDFFKFLVKDCTRIFILMFLNEYKKKNCKTSTRNQRLACIRSYANYILSVNSELGVFVYNNILSIPMATAEKPMIGWIKKEHLQAIFESTPNSRIGIRDKMIMILLYQTGARASELINIRIKDVNLFDSSSSIRLHGKGNKVREIPINKKTSKLVKEYLQYYHNPLIQEEYLFFTIYHNSKGMMSISNLERIVTKYASIARKINPDIPLRITPHMFRHTIATHMLRKNVPLPFIGRFLGHVGLDTTAIYATCDIDMFRDAIEKVEKADPNMHEDPIWQNNNDSELLSLLCGLS